MLELIDFYTRVRLSPSNVWFRKPSLTSFYANARTLTMPFLNEDTQERVLHGPGLLPVAFTIKKWKKKRYPNIFRLIIESRQKIRTFSLENWKEYIGSEPRVVYRDPLDLLKEIIIDPLQTYFSQLDQSENVNGCIFNKKIDLFDFLNLTSFHSQMA
jgi:hypothetical protein